MQIHNYMHRSPRRSCDSDIKDATFENASVAVERQKSSMANLAIRRDVGRRVRVAVKDGDQLHVGVNNNITKRKVPEDLGSCATYRQVSNPHPRHLFNANMARAHAKM
jgi:hypothetical protein